MTENSCPRLSVVLPVFNGSRLLREAVQSVLNQSYGDFELIAIDDGSTDETLEILRGFRDSRIRVFTQARSGLIATLRRGVALARAPVVARMDHDDECLPLRFARQMAFMQAHPQVGVCGGAVVIDTNGQRRMLRFPTTDVGIRWHLCFTSPIVHPTVVFRKEIIQQVGGYRQSKETDVGVEDYDLWTRLAPITRYANLDDAVLILRKHGQNLTMTNPEAHLRQSQGVSQRYIQGILRRPVSIEDVRTIRLDVSRPDNVLSSMGLLKEMHVFFCAMYACDENEAQSICEDVNERNMIMSSRAFRGKTMMAACKLAWRSIPSGLVSYFVRHRIHRMMVLVYSYLRCARS